MALFRMKNTIQNYAWGSRRAVPALMGRAESSEPEAEVWMGSHPKAPSVLVEKGVTLLDAIGKDPEHMIGARARSLLPEGTGTPQLPYLLKILAAENGLSIQAHPSRELACAGYESEELAGIDRLAPDRNYRDRNHKPELICAIDDFYGLCGFRIYEEIAADFRGLYESLSRVGGIPPASGNSKTNPGLREITTLTREFYESPDQSTLQSWFSAVSGLLVAGNRAKTASGRGAFAVALEQYARKALIETDSGGKERRLNRYWWVLELLRQFPGDPGAASPLYLNLFHLKPGGALFLGAGLLHAYLSGTGIEIMANSDNVLRAGCTAKHVDPAELVRAIAFTESPPKVVEPEQSGTLSRYRTPAKEFELLRLSGSQVRYNLALDDAPAIVLAVDGNSVISDESASIVLAPGESCFVAAETRSFSVASSATVYLASLPDGVRIA